MKTPYEYKKRIVPPRPDRAFSIGQGRISGYVSLFLGMLSLMGVLAYLYPSLLTTTELREVYDAEKLQVVLKYGMWLSLLFGLFTLVRNKKKRMGMAGITLTVIAFALGGYTIPVGSVEAKPLSLGVDWLILAFLGSVIVFTTLEKLFPRYPEQVILRSEWKLDLFYFCFNHLLISAIILFGNSIASAFDWAASASIQQFIREQSLLLQIVVIVICADFVLYWEHRLFHEVSRLWKVHAVHHSVETLDWLAGSRAHVIQVFIERSLVMIPLYLLGPDKAALDIYVTIAALQAIIIHTNIKFTFGPLKYLFVTPQYHHWHHSSEHPAIDTNYAAHTVLFDRIFGTYHMPTPHWPADYGTTHRLPRTFMGQLLYPFRKN